MSDENNPSTPDQAPDQIKNLKAETERKIGNMQQENQRLAQQIANLTAAMQPAAPARQEETDEQLMYSNPSAYAARIQARTEASIMSKMGAANESASKKNNILTQLANDYPELQDLDSDLMRKATDIWSSLPADERQSPLAYKVAVRDAAMELNIKPKKQRPADQFDDPSIGGNFGINGNRQASRRATKLPQEVMDFAAMVGVDTSDPEVKKRLVDNLNRNWRSFKEVAVEKKKR